MALSTEIICSHCNRTSYETHSAAAPAPTVCSACRKQEALTAREEYLNELKKLPLETRISIIEAEMYDNARSPKEYNPWDLIG